MVERADKVTAINQKDEPSGEPKPAGTTSPPARRRPQRRGVGLLISLAVVIIGQKGLSENLRQEIDSSLSHHELLKLRIPALAKPDRRELADQICSTHNATLVEAIGGIIVIYRRNPEIDRYAVILSS